MKSIRAFLVSLLFCAAAVAQLNTLIKTTLSASVTRDQTSFAVASATGISAGTMLYVDTEAMLVNSISGTTVGVRRGHTGTAAVAHLSGAMVLLGAPNLFYAHDPSGSCTAASILVTPWVNVRTGNQWLCSSVSSSWVPGFGNLSIPVSPTAAVASAAGLITPSGPLFHITGTAAITGFNIPLGFTAGQICVVPDGIFTTTTANNIALASTAVVSKTLCWTYDQNTAKFYPSY